LKKNEAPSDSAAGVPVGCILSTGQTRYHSASCVEIPLMAVYPFIVLMNEVVNKFSLFINAQCNVRSNSNGTRITIIQRTLKLRYRHLSSLRSYWSKGVAAENRFEWGTEITENKTIPILKLFSN
jgi:hypothetical protein